MTQTTSTASSVTINHDPEKFTVISFLPRPSGSKADEPSFQPHTVKRECDGEIFSIGDLVANGTEWRGQKCKGHIKSFDYLEDKVFVTTTWSGVGWNLGSLRKRNDLPSQHQIGDGVWLTLWSANVIVEILAVHFYEGKVKYDLKVLGTDGDSTRIYNVDSIYVKKKVGEVETT